MDSKNLKVSAVDTRLVDVVRGGSMGWVPPKIYCLLHSLVHVQLQLVFTAPQPQQFNLMLVCTLIAIFGVADNDGIIRKLQELHRRVTGGAMRMIGKNKPKNNIIILIMNVLFFGIIDLMLNTALATV